MSEQVAAWLTGIGAIVAATAGLVITIREIRRRERRNCLRNIEALETQVNAVENDFIAWRRYTFDLRALLADHGLDAPSPPDATAHRGGVLRDGPRSRRRLHRLRRAGREPGADEPADIVYDDAGDPGVDDDDAAGDGEPR